MNESDQVLAGFHPTASRLLFRQLQAFDSATASIDRASDEPRYRGLCAQFVRTLREELQAEARRFIEKNQERPQIGAIDLGLRHLVEDYVHQFVQRC
ncbi:MAG: hypothetical protein EOO16_17415 [Chitinophagaceae bacterium]|nr:MAG: hypothetical protein EOO16_17415 [Chitinophagaceae bacterium]